MPLARDLHPEFGYIGNAPAVLRKLGFVIAFAGFGLIATLSNLSVFVTEPDDPMKALALAPEQALRGTTPAPPTSPVLENRSVESSSTDKPPGASNSACRDQMTEGAGVDCAPTRMRKPRSVQPVNERPAIAAISIGHRDEPALIPAESAAAVSASPQSTDAPIEEAAAAPAAEAPAAAEAVTPTVTPTVPARKSRTRSAQRRERSEGSRGSGSSYRGTTYSYHSVQPGYARVW